MNNPAAIKEIERIKDFSSQSSLNKSVIKKISSCQMLKNIEECNTSCLSSETECENMPSAKKAKTVNTKQFSTPPPSKIITQNSSFTTPTNTAPASSSLAKNNYHLNSTPTNAQSTSASSSLANDNQKSASNMSLNGDLDNSICFQDETTLGSNNLVSKQSMFLSKSSNSHLNENSNQAEEVEVSDLLRMMADVIIVIFYFILL